MGREIRRVPADFAWPIGKTWQGFLMPDKLRADTCTDCAGRGSTTAAQWVQACASMILMLDDDLRSQELGRPMHPYFNDFYSTAYGTRPSADIREVGRGLAGRESSFLGHDSIDGYVAYKKIIEAAGLDPEVWGICTTCSGHGSIDSYQGQSAEADAWEPTEPPTGDAWQLWETVSEGSPISPVFTTPEDLARWMVSGQSEWMMPTDYDAALRFVNDGWAPSLAYTAETGLVDGVTFVGGDR